MFKKEPKHFPFFFKRVMEAVLAGDKAGLTLKEQTVLLVFLDHCFNSPVSTALVSFCWRLQYKEFRYPDGIFQNWHNDVYIINEWTDTEQSIYTNSSFILKTSAEVYFHVFVKFLIR